jgi:hypothetical protein
MKLLSLLLIVVSCGRPLTFISEESKNSKGEKIINRIAFIQQDKKDIWMMHQREEKSSDWDRLAIVVDRSAKPHRARFFQLAPGPLEWSDNLPRTEYRVSCFLCHPNGPRVIRPMNEQSVGEKMQTWWWNTKIKSYGRVLADASHAVEDLTLKRPFRVEHPIENAELKLESCSQCHKEEGFLARGTLTRQNALTIRHMVDSGHMPPWPWKMSAKEKKHLELFLVGL